MIAADTITTGPNGDRYFANDFTAWQWIDGRMSFMSGEESCFTSPDELLACPDVFETDVDGRAL